jgi:hypothetical protein
MESFFSKYELYSCQEPPHRTHLRKSLIYSHISLLTTDKGASIIMILYILILTLLKRKWKHEENVNRNEVCFGEFNSLQFRYKFNCDSCPHF